MQQYPGVDYKLEGEAKEQRESFGSLAWALVFVFFIILEILSAYILKMKFFLLQKLIPFV